MNLQAKELRAFLLLATALLSACGSVSPVVTWTPSSEPDPGIDTLPVARKNAAELKAALQTRADEFVGEKAALNNTLLGLGVLTLGLATGKAHRDAYTTTAGVAGSAFLFGNQNLQASVLSAYQDGIGAVNCAVAAVGPMQVGGSTLSEIRSDATSLRSALPALATAVAKAEVALAGTANLPTALATAAQQQIDAARATYTKGSAASGQAAVLPQTVGKVANKLKGALSEIHKVVNDFAAKGVADSRAVVESLNSLVSIITGFGRNVGVDVLAKSTGAGNAPAAGGNQSDTSNASSASLATPDENQLKALTSALQALAEANARVAALADPLSTQLDGLRTFDASGELAKCKVTNAAGAFSIDRTQLDFTANDKDDQTARIVASGGTTPYVGRPRDSPTFGIELTNPISGDRTFEVKVPKTVKAGTSLTLSITDSATPPNERLVTVRVKAAADTPAGNQSDTGNDALKQALDRAKGTFFSAGTGTGKTRFTLSDSKSDTKGSAVTLSCKPVPAAPPTTEEVLEQLLSTLVSLFKLPQATADAVKAKPETLTLRATDGCIK